MALFSSTRSSPIALSASTEAQVYGLTAIAMALTLVGVVIGLQFAEVLFASGIVFMLLIVELAIVFTSPWWMERSPLNVILFGLFPLLSGITVTPYILYVLTGYANGGAILLNALAATVCMTGAAAVFARTTRWHLASLGPALVLGLLGLIVMNILQIFFPMLRTGVLELVVAGGGVMLFAVFLAMDLQRVAAMGKVGANPFMLALSLYLDIFNLFLYILRFMLAIAGRRD